MNRIEFMIELERLLADMSEEEKTDALSFYHNYFDDAGIEEEENIVNELGSPEKVAAIVRGADSPAESVEGEYTERGYTEEYLEDKQEVGYKKNQEKKKKNPFKKKSKANKSDIIDEAVEVDKKGINLWKWIALALLVYIGWPLIIAAAFIWLIIAVALDFVTIIVIFAGVIVFALGIALFIMGIFHLFTTPLVGVLMCVGGVCVMCMGALLTMFIAKTAIKTLPIAFRRAIDIIRKPFHRKEK